MSIRSPLANACTRSEAGRSAALVNSSHREPIRPASKPIGTEATSVTIVAAESRAPVCGPERLNRSWSVGRTGRSAESATALANASAETAGSARSAWMRWCREWIIFHQNRVGRPISKMRVLEQCEKFH